VGVQVQFEDPAPLLSLIRGLGSFKSSVSTSTCSVAVGEALHRAVCGESSIVLLTTYDVSGARKLKGGEEVTVECVGAGASEAHVLDREDGTYEVKRHTPPPKSLILQTRTCTPACSEKARE
jgi:hypothetical protein